MDVYIHSSQEYHYYDSIDKSLYINEFYLFLKAYLYMLFFLFYEKSNILYMNLKILLKIYYFKELTTSSQLNLRCFRQ